MAASAVIGALRIVLGADTATLEVGLQKATKQTESFAKSVEKIAAGIGLERIFEKVFDGISHGLKSALEEADKLGKTAAKVGIPVEELTALKLAADLSDVSIEQLSTGLGKLSKNLLDVARGAGDEARTAFKQLGVSIYDSNGNLKSANQVLNDVSTSFEKMPDGVVKTATAMALFGKSGKDLIPLLNEGGDSLKKFAEQAKAMGLVISQDTANQSQKFNDNLKLLNLASQGLANMIVAALLPALVRLSESWVDVATKGEKARGVAGAIVNAFKELVVVAYQATAISDTLAAIATLAKDIAKTPFAPDASKTIKDAKTLADTFGGMRERLSAARDEATQTFTQITVGGHEAKKAVDSIADTKLSKALEDIQFKTRILRGDFDGLAQGFPELAKGIVPISQIGTSVDGLSAGLRKLNEAQLAFKGEQLTQDNLMPWQQFEEQLKRIDLLYANNKISAETYALASRKAAESTGQAWDLAASKIVGDLATGLKAFAAQNKSLAGVAKAAAIAQALINTYTAATKALATYPPPLSYIAAGAAVVAGLGYVAQIQAQQFAQGGSFKVGGKGGIDSQMVQFMATPGEMVDVRTPGQQAPTSTGGGATEITLRARRLADMLTLDDVRSLVESLNSANRDGYRLKFAT